MAFVSIGIILALFAALALFDHRTRKAGHKFRDASSIRRSELDVRQNARAANTTMNGPVDRQWSKPDDR